MHPIYILVVYSYDGEVLIRYWKLIKCSFCEVYDRSLLQYFMYKQLWHRHVRLMNLRLTLHCRSLRGHMFRGHMKFSGTHWKLEIPLQYICIHTLKIVRICWQSSHYLRFFEICSLCCNFVKKIKGFFSGEGASLPPPKTPPHTF